MDYNIQALSVYVVIKVNLYGTDNPQVTHPPTWVHPYFPSRYLEWPSWVGGPPHRLWSRAILCFLRDISHDGSIRTFLVFVLQGRNLQSEWENKIWVAESKLKELLTQVKRQRRETSVSTPCSYVRLTPEWEQSCHKRVRCELVRRGLVIRLHRSCITHYSTFKPHLNLQPLK